MTTNPFDDRYAIANDLSDPFADPGIQDDAEVVDLNEGQGLFTPGPSKPIPLPTILANSKSTHPPLTRELTESELAQREAQLSEREHRLIEDQEAFRLQSISGKKANFPPFFPILYHDIDVEIRPEDRQQMRWLYWTWLALMATLVWNSVSTFFILISHASGVNTGGTDFGVSFLYCFLVGAGSFFLWYRPVYNAYMKDKALYYCKSVV